MWPSRPRKEPDQPYTKEECLIIIREHRKSVMNVMNIFNQKLLKLWEKHDKDKEVPPGNLILYTRLLNNPSDKEAAKEWTNTHNSTPHHVEWFLKCQKPILQYLVEMVCDNVVSAIERDAKYNNIFEENKNRYIKKWLPENLAEICAHTFVDLRDSLHK